MAEATEKLNAANSKLTIVKARVKELNDKLKVLTDEYDAANKTKMDAINTVETGQRKLGLANR